jgi:HPt (histidine-containing phosphotransfer) domain-containing protein
MTTDQPPDLDPGALQRLAEWGGPELRRKMINLFLEHAPGRVREIAEGLEGDDLELAHRSAHSLRSSAANVGAELVSHLSGRIEGELDQGSREGAGQLLPRLEKALDDVKAALVESMEESP